MMTMPRFLWGLVFACGLVAGQPALAQQWAKDMFSKTSHDFGTVARGAKAEVAFTFKNIYNEDVRIQRVQTSCGCAGIKYPTELIKTYEKGKIVVRVDTRSFLGQKDATLKVYFDKPYPALVLLKLHCYIRKDVVFEPGAIQFGSVRQGEPARRKTTVRYAGRDDWAITEVKSPYPYVETKLKELQRGYGRVTYELWVELKPDAPAGYLTGQLLLRTNDSNPRSSQVPLAIDGVVEADLTVRPTSLTFLAVQSGETIERKVVVQAPRPFRVTDMQCDDPRVEWKLPTESAKFHVIPVSFTPRAETGKVNSRLKIHTDLDEGRYAAVKVFAEVAAPTQDQP